MRINKPNPSAQITNKRTVNHEGGDAYTMSLKERLVSGVTTSFYNESKFYGDNSSQIIADIREMLDHDAYFVAQLAVYARTSMNLRTIPTAIVGELALHPLGRSYLRAAMYKVILRPDQMKELVAYVNNAVVQNGSPLNLASSIRQLKLGLSDAMNRFDEYQIAKYNGGDGIKLKDIVMLAHPKPEDALHGKIFKKLIEDKLDIPMTWETEISAKGNKAAVWDNLIDSRKLPYMAALRNLRNLSESGAKKLDIVLKMIVDDVEKSKQLPFRFYSAYKETAGNIKISAALEAALEKSVANVPEFKGTTFISSDNSMSMDAPLSAKSKVTYKDVANLFQAMLGTKGAITSVFGDTFALVPQRGNSILTTANKFRSTNVGCSTNGYLAVRHLNDTKKFVDRIIIFSDCQLYDSNAAYNFGYAPQATIQQEVEKYRKNVNPNVWVYVFDLAGYGTKPTIGKRVVQISGWNDNILHYIKMIEEGTGNQITEIESISI
jgi:hypothetical protein